MSRVHGATTLGHRDRLPSNSRYELLVRIASGGMATVYVGRLSSSHGISRLVAIKRAHAHLLEEPSFKKLLVAEARLASRIHHPNVVAVHNVEELDGELLLVMDYVEGAPLSDLVREGAPRIPPSVGVRILLDACAGLHAAHELLDEDGTPLGIVHRDVSPQNILVGTDGVARVTDFGIAKSNDLGVDIGRTRTGVIKGKVGYMAPEYVDRGEFDVRSDVFALGVVLWETLTSQRLFRGKSELDTIRLMAVGPIPPPSQIVPGLGPSLDAVVLEALSRDRRKRFPSAAAMAEALEAAARRGGLLGKPADVATEVRRVAGAALAERRRLVRGDRADDLDAETVLDPGNAAPTGELATADLLPEDPPVVPFTAPLAVPGLRPHVDTGSVVLPTGILPSPGFRRAGAIVAVAAAAVLALGLAFAATSARGTRRPAPVASAPAESPIATASAALPPSEAIPDPAPTPTSALVPTPSAAPAEVVSTPPRRETPSAPSPPSTPTRSVPVGVRRPTNPGSRTKPLPADRAPPNPYGP